MMGKQDLTEEIGKQQRQLAWKANGGKICVNAEWALSDSWLDRPKTKACRGRRELRNWISLTSTCEAACVLRRKKWIASGRPKRHCNRVSMWRSMVTTCLPNLLLAAAMTSIRAWFLRGSIYLAAIITEEKATSCRCWRSMISSCKFDIKLASWNFKNISSGKCTCRKESIREMARNSVSSTMSCCLWTPTSQSTTAARHRGLISCPSGMCSSIGKVFWNQNGDKTSFQLTWRKKKNL